MIHKFVYIVFFQDKKNYFKDQEIIWSIWSNRADAEKAKLRCAASEHHHNVDISKWPISEGNKATNR